MKYADHLPAVWLDAALSIVALCRMKPDGSQYDIVDVAFIPCEADGRFDTDNATVWFNDPDKSGIDIPIPVHFPGEELVERLRSRLLLGEEVRNGKGKEADTGHRVAGRKT